MLHEHFLGRKPSHFQINPLIKAYIISETFMWAAWNFILPIFSVFIVRQVKGGSIETAASGYSIYLICRVLFELISGRMLIGTSDKQKIRLIIAGIFCFCIAYIGFAFAQNIWLLFIFYGVAGTGVGLEAPAKNALFSMHLDADKEATEWSMSDAVQFFCMALATALGGFIAVRFGFRLLFLLAFIFTVIAGLPYLLYRPAREQKV